MPKKYSYWLVSGKYSMMQQLAVVFFGLIGFMFLARLFAPAKFGVWTLFITISSIVETARSALVKNGYIRFINSTEKADHPGIESATLVTNCVFSLIIIITFFLTGGWLEDLFHTPGLELILNYYSLTLLLLIPFSQKEVFFNARMDFKSIFWMYFARNGLFMCVTAFLFLTGNDVSLELLAIFYGACVLCGVVVCYIFSNKHEKAAILWNRNIFWRFINYGKYVFGNNFFSLLFRNTDSFMTARFISPVALSYYTSSTRITNFADMPSQVLGDVMFPRAAQSVKSGNLADIKRMYEKTVAATLTIIIPIIIFVCLFSHEMIYVLAGRKYMEAGSVLQIMIFYSFFLPFIRQFGNIMDATGRPHVNFILMGTFAVVNIFLNLVLIKSIGLLGAAYGTLLSYFLLFISTQVILGRMLHISQINIMKNIFMLYPDYLKLLRTSFSKFFGYSYEK